MQEMVVSIERPLPIPGRMGWWLQKTLPVCARCQKPAVPFIQKSLCPSGAPTPAHLREGVGPVSSSITSPRPRPSRFPAELGCSLNFQRWFDFLQWYHMLLCKQSTWSGQTKERVCCDPSPYHGSARPARRGPGPRAVPFQRG